MSIESTETVKRSYAMTNNSKYVVKNTKTNKYLVFGGREYYPSRAWGTSKLVTLLLKSFTKCLTTSELKGNITIN